MNPATLIFVAAALLGSADAQPNGARQPGGWNCDAPEETAGALALDGYRLARHEKAANGQDIQVWKNRVPRKWRKPDRDDYIRVQHTEHEDCVIVEKSNNG